MSSRIATVPSVEELEARAEALLPRLRERAAQTEALRRVPDETIEEFCQAGFFRLFQPARYGGYELDYGPVQLALGGQLGRACGSSAWVQCVVACHAWLLGMFPRAAQDAVWADDPEALLSTAISMRSARGRPVAGVPGTSAAGVSVTSPVRRSTTFCQPFRYPGPATFVIRNMVISSRPSSRKTSCGPTGLPWRSASAGSSGGTW